MRLLGSSLDELGVSLNLKYLKRGVFVSVFNAEADATTAIIDL